LVTWWAFTIGGIDLGLMIVFFLIAHLRRPAAGAATAV
jgi:hypothetical protein